MSFIDLLTAFSIIFGAWFYYFETTLKDKHSTSMLMDTLLKHNYFVFYRSYLKYSLDKLDDYLGKPTLSWNSIVINLSFHYTLAIGYIFLVFFIIWFLGGDSSIGTLEILPEKETYLDRITILIYIIIISLLYYFMIGDVIGNIIEKLNDKLQVLLPAKIKKYTMYIISLIVVIGLFEILTILLMVLGKGLLIIFSMLLGIALKGTTRSGIELMTVIGGTILFSGIFLTIVSIGALPFLKLNMSAHSFLIFFLLIPFLNSILDFISLTLSRYFSRKILNENLFLIMVHLLLDFIFAVLFLLALVVLLYYSIDFFNSFLDLKLQIPIQTMLANTLHHPFSLDNAWITFMLLSTLVPTLLHIVLALLSILLYITKTTDWLVWRIDESQQADNKRIKTSALFAFPLTMLSIILFYLLIYIPITLWLLNIK